MIYDIKKIFAILGLAVLTGLFIYYARSKRFYDGSLDPATIGKRMKSFNSTQLFDEGAYGQITGKDLETSCPQTQKVEQLLCSQGFYYVARSKELNKSFNELQKGQKVEVTFSSVGDALGTGVALSFLRKKPTDIEVTNNSDVYLQYLYDGWGYRESFSLKEPKYDSLCQFDLFNEHCQFGVGRAVFYIGASESKVSKMNASSQKGFFFSRAYEDKGDGKDYTRPMEKMGLALRQEDSAGNQEVVNCVTQGIKHSIQCYN